MIKDRQKINVFIDDSGVFTDSEAERFFVYAGYLLIGDDQRAEAHNRYKKLSSEIKAAIKHIGELKAAHLTKYDNCNDHKRALVNIMKRYESFACVVDIPSIKEETKRDRLSRYRYKDYCLKVGLKRKLENMLLNNQNLDPSLPTDLKIFIDEQHTATSGFYELKSSMEKEYIYGIGSRLFGNYHPPIFTTNDVSLSLKYCDSSHNYLIQAADLLANRIHSSYQTTRPRLRNIENLRIEKFP